MSQTMLSMLAALAGEIVLLALVLLTIAYLRNRAQRRRDLKAVKTLVARIRNGKSERETTIVQFLEQGMGLSGEALDKARVAVLRGELGLLQRIAGIYRLRDSAALARIDDDLFAANAAYHALSGDGLAAGDAHSEAEPADQAELENLRKENQRLADELTITMETMSRMLNEYSTMFAGNGSDEATPIAATAAAGASAAAAGEDEAESPMGAELAEAEPVEAEPAEAEPLDGDAVDDIIIASGGLTADDEAAPVAEADTTAEDPAADILFDEPVAGGAVDADFGEIVEPPSVDELATEDMPADDLAADVVTTADSAADEVGDSQLPDEDDEIAAILREAQLQESSARKTAEDEANGGAGASPDEVPAIEEGDAQTVAFDEPKEADVESLDDIDDLFDAVADEATDGGDAAAPKSGSAT